MKRWRRRSMFAAGFACGMRCCVAARADVRDLTRCCLCACAAHCARTTMSPLSCVGVIELATRQLVVEVVVGLALCLYGATVRAAPFKQIYSAVEQAKRFVADADASRLRTRVR